MTQPGDEIAQHPFFGAVTAEKGRFLFHPRDARAGVEYWAQSLSGATPAIYDELAPRLAAFEAFCRRIDENDRQVRERFEAWPRSAGPFELVDAVIDTFDPARRRHGEEACKLYPELEMPILGLQLRYRALDQEAWDYAGITWYPPVFSAFFDEATGLFSGIQDTVDERMRELPDTIVRSPYEDAYYRHRVFGRRKLNAPSVAGSLSRLGATVVAGRKVPLELYVLKRDMALFQPEMLDRFVPLAERLTALDAMVRADFPEEKRTDWLELRYAPENHRRLRSALDAVFPGATAADQVTASRFAAALTLRRACFSLSPQGSGGAALTLDYHLLPQRLDNYLFAAKFAADGTLMDVVVES